MTSRTPRAWWQFTDDVYPVMQTMQVDDVPMAQPIGFVWFAKPRYRVKAGKR